MSRYRVVSLAMLAARVLAAGALAACSNNSSSMPAAPTVTVAGEYAGPVTDSVAGQQSGDIGLAQHGSNVGGAMTLTAGASSSVESVTLSLSGTSFTGSGVMDVNGSACTFAITGTYANNALTATYTGVSGCTRTGSWALSQTCTGVAAGWKRRPEGVVPAC